jgi:hypothetical protein
MPAASEKTSLEEAGVCGSTAALPAKGNHNARPTAVYTIPCIRLGELIGSWIVAIEFKCDVEVQQDQRNAH